MPIYERQGVVKKDKIVVYVNDKRIDGAFDQLVDSAFEAGAASVRKELEAAKAELEAAKSRTKLSVVWALRFKLEPETFWKNHAGSPLLFGLRQDADDFRSGMQSDNWEVVPYPVGDGADEINATIARKEQAEYDLGLARSKARESARWIEYISANVGHKLKMLEENIERIAEQLETRDKLLKKARNVLYAWKKASLTCSPHSEDDVRLAKTRDLELRLIRLVNEGVSYKRQALEAASDAAAWKSAANVRDATPIRSPNELTKRLGELMAEVAAAEASIQPLDRYRVLSTAKNIAADLAKFGDKQTGETSTAEIAATAIAQLLRLTSKKGRMPYKLKN